MVKVAESSELIFHAIALGLNNDRLGAVQEAVEDGAGEGGVVIEDLGPGLEVLVGGQDDGAAFVAFTDDLEKEIGTRSVDREIPNLVNLC